MHQHFELYIVIFKVSFIINTFSNQVNKYYKYHTLYINYKGAFINIYFTGNILNIVNMY